MAHEYAEFLTRLENGTEVVIPLDELMRIFLSGKFPDGTDFDGVNVSTTGTSLLGIVGIDQATAKANEVVVKSITAGANSIGTVGLNAGTALVGKVGIDQTTPGTTDSVSVATGQGAGATIGATADAAVITDAAGTLSSKLRGLISLWLGGLKAGEAHVGEVGSNEKQVDVTPAITAGAYTADDVIGGVQTIADASRVAGKAIILQSLVITDLAMQDAALSIFFFNANPTNGTYTDNGALDIHDTDLGMCIGAVSVAASDYIDAADNSVATLPHIGLELIPTTTSLYAIAQTKDADTWASVADLTFKYLFDRN